MRTWIWLSLIWFLPLFPLNTYQAQPMHILRRLPNKRNSIKNKTLPQVNINEFHIQSVSKHRHIWCLILILLVVKCHILGCSTKVSKQIIKDTGGSCRQMSSLWEKKLTLDRSCFLLQSVSTTVKWLTAFLFHDLSHEQLLLPHGCFQFSLI